MAGNYNSGRRPGSRRIKELAGTLRKDRLPSVNGSQRGSGKIDAPDALPEELRGIFAELARLFGDVITAQDTYTLASWAAALWIELEAIKELTRDGILVLDAAHAGRIAKHPATTVWKAASERSAAFGARFGADPATRARLLEILSGKENESQTLDDLLGDD